MPTFLATTGSNEAAVHDVSGLRRVLDRYFLVGDVRACLREVDGTPTLMICGFDWPAAWSMPAGADADDLDPDWDADGDEGFLQLLQDIAPYLTDALVVQAVGAEACRFPLAACQWRVQPGASEVEVNGFGAELEPQAA